MKTDDCPQSDLSQANEEWRKKAEEQQRRGEIWRETAAQHSAILEAFDGLIYICSQEYEVE